MGASVSIKVGELIMNGSGALRYAAALGLPAAAAPLVIPTQGSCSSSHELHMQEHYLDDLYVGQTFGTGSLTVSAEAIKAFAQQFDFQPFHLDEDAAKSTFFGELVASGWHTACLTMKLLLEGDYRPAGGFIGGKADELRWPTPTRPGDVLTCTTEILEIRPSATRPGQGTVKMRTTTFNASKEVVYILVMNGIAKRRPAV